MNGFRFKVRVSKAKKTGGKCSERLRCQFHFGEKRALFCTFFSQRGADISLDAPLDILGRSGNKGLARDVFVEFDVAVGDALHDFRSHLGDGLVGGTVHLEAVGEQPLADKFL